MGPNLKLSHTADTVRYLTSSTGATATSYTYDSYGKQLSGSTTASNYTYQNEQKDPESGYTFLRARYYDPTVGRLTALDPAAGTPEDLASQNRYNYADDNPVNFSDPSGASISSFLQSLFGGSNRSQCDTGGAGNTVALAAGSVIVGKGNKNDFRMLSPKEISHYGIDPHAVKEELVGSKGIAKYDIFKQQSTGDLYVGRKGLPDGELQPVNMRIFNGKAFDVAPGARIPIEELPVEVEFPDIFLP